MKNSSSQNGSIPYHFSLVKSGKGFTLIEVLIYLGLFSVLMSGALIGAYQLLQGGAHDRAISFAETEGTFINRKINWALTGATVASASSGTLDITRPDLGEVLHFDATGPNMTLRRNAGPAVVLNSEEFKPENVTFSVTPGANGLPTLVTVTFDINSRPFVLKKYI